MITSDPQYPAYQALVELACRSGLTDPAELEKHFLEEETWAQPEHLVNLKTWCAEHTKRNEEFKNL